MLESSDTVLINTEEFHLLDTSVRNFWDGKKLSISHKCLLKNHLFTKYNWFVFTYKDIKKYVPNYLILSKQEDLVYKIKESKFVGQYYTEYIVTYENVFYESVFLKCSGTNRAKAYYNMYNKLRYKDFLKYGNSIFQ